MINMIYFLKFFLKFYSSKEDRILCGPLDRLFTTYWPLSCLEFETPALSICPMRKTQFDASSSSPFELDLVAPSRCDFFLALLLHCNKSSMVQVVPVFSQVNKWLMV